MAIAFPRRPPAHQIEDESIAFFNHHLPRGWICDRPQHDYGIDLRVGLANNEMINGQQLVVQMKASAAAPPGDSVTAQLEVQTLHYLRNMLEVALLVKYVADEQEAYWLLLKDYIANPRENQKTVTIRIPRANRLSENPWDVISAHVQAVHHRKLRANVQGR